MPSSVENLVRHRPRSPGPIHSAKWRCGRALMCEQRSCTLCRHASVRAGVHAPMKSVSVPAPISFFPPVKPMSAVHTDRQNRYRRLQGGQFRECCRAVNMAPMWNRSFYLLCLLVMRISSLDGNEICLTSALNDLPVP